MPYPFQFQQVQSLLQIPPALPFVCASLQAIEQPPVGLGSFGHGDHKRTQFLESSTGLYHIQVHNIACCSNLDMCLRIVT